MPEVIAESKVDLDSFMSGWREKFCGQHNPKKLAKIRKNLIDLQEVLSEEDTLLDVGCNIGEVYAFLNHKRYEGIDLSADAIGKAVSEYQARFKVGDLFDLEGNWDVVLASRVLMHVAPFDKAMAKLLGVARKKCVVFVPLADEDSCQLLKLHDDQVCFFRRFSEYSMKSIGPCKIVRREPYSTVIYG